MHLGRAALGSEGQRVDSHHIWPSISLLHWYGALFRVVLPLPYKLPPEPYGTKDIPWTTDTDFPGLDSLNQTIHHQVSLYGYIQPDQAA
jgi:hypothetical protein